MLLSCTARFDYRPIKLLLPLTRSYQEIIQIGLRYVTPAPLKTNVFVVDDPGALPLAITFHAFSVKEPSVQNRER